MQQRTPHCVTQCRQARLVRRHICNHKPRAAEQPAARLARLDRQHICNHHYRTAEQPEARQARLERLLIIGIIFCISSGYVIYYIYKYLPHIFWSKKGWADNTSWAENMVTIKGKGLGDFTMGSLGLGKRLVSSGIWHCKVVEVIVGRFNIFNGHQTMFLLQGFGNQQDLF